ncbi:hypothetical protein ADIS_1358 [Lunatimonas lonarensis]|uniref:Molybdopterin synthase sulfur carrier subunit n=1 Tax=Lunatimonas lonarensis TaxID=1232681 RepID=R7ZVJ0_9BACT|nr:MoaD/ThiS family protein [Lunatimonas lonarensis]EON78161.1 hypothetical protein ADIS_1358 [Lunatimonas lonarensis]
MKIKLFGIAREIVGSAELILPLDPPPKNVKDFKRWLCESYPEFSELRSLAIAVDHEYADDDVILPPNAEIALIPPVSGG